MAIYGKYISDNNIVSLIPDTYINDICISAEEIKRLSESLKIEDYNIEESFVGDLANAKLKKFCKDFDIDYKFVKNIIDKHSSEISKEIKEKGLNKNTIKYTTDSISSALNKLSKIKLSEKIKNKFNNYDQDKINCSILLLLAILLIHSIIELILTIIFFNNPLIGKAILAIGVAPITEEISKAIAIKCGFATEFTVVFNLYEFSSYVIIGTGNVIVAGGKISDYIGKMVRARLRCIGMHVTTTIIQKITSDKDVMKAIGVKDTETSSKVGLFIGMVIHCTWNSLATFSKKFEEIITR